MNNLIQVLSFLSILITMATLSSVLGSRIRAEVLPISAISLLAAVMYPLNFFMTTEQVMYVMYAASLAQLVYLKFNGGLSLLGFARQHRLFLAFSLFLFVTTFGAKINFWDDHFWASFVKYLTIYGDFWAASDQLVNGRYLPGMPLWESYFIFENFDTEQGLFFAVGLVFASCLTALIPRGLSKLHLAGMLLIYLTIVYGMVGYALRSISVDCVMGLMFGVALVEIYRAEGARINLPLLIVLVFMATIKETAFLLSLLCLFIYAVKMIRLQGWDLKHFGGIAATISVMVLNLWLWQSYLQGAGISSTLQGSLLQKFLADLHAPAPFLFQFLPIFFDGAISRPFPGSRVGAYIHSSLILNFLFLAAAMHLSKIEISAKIGYYLGFIGYSLAILTFWLYLTTEYEARNLASMERYFGTFFMGFFLLVAHHLCVGRYFRKRAVLGVAAALVVIFLPSPSMLMPNSFPRMVLPAAIKEKLAISSATPERDSVQALYKNLVSVAPPKSKVWLIWQRSQGYELMIMRYLALPVVMTSIPWSLGPAYESADIWTANLTQSEFLDYLDQVDYVAVGRIDDQFLNQYSWAFLETPEDNEIFQKVETADGPRLKKVSARPS